MSEEAAFQFTAAPGDPSLGKLLAIQIEGSGSLVDNLSLSDDRGSTVIRIR
jgi:hypothetical protein